MQYQGEGLTRLAGAVLLKAVKDLDNEKSQSEVFPFVESEWFSELAQIAGFSGNEADRIQEKIPVGRYERCDIRAAYR